MHLRSTPTLTATLVALAIFPAAATAAGSDAAATQSYIQANYRMVQYAGSRIPIGEAAIRRVLAQVRRECPAAAANSPQNPESTQLSNEVIGLMVTSAIHDALPTIREFVRAASRLHWTSRSLTGAVQAYVGKLRTMASLAPPPVCADVRSWAASGFRTLPADTVSFDARFMPNWVALGELPGGLRQFAGGPQRALLRRSEQRETELTDFEARAVETWGRIMNSLELSP
jgi:hypothetical protein